MKHYYLLLIGFVLSCSDLSALTYADWIASAGLTGDQAAHTADLDGSTSILRHHAAGLLWIHSGFMSKTNKLKQL